MFVLRVHSVDHAKQLVLGDAAFVSSTNRHHSHDPNSYSERRGVVHLYRRASHSSLPNHNPDSRSTSLFVSAIPSYLSPSDVLGFFESFSPTEVLPLGISFLRNDAIEDRYSALVKFDDQTKANNFYRCLNGKRFSSGEAELCHLLFVASIEYTDMEEATSVSPDGYTELPTCPICLERLDPDTSGVSYTLCDHSFHCTCTSKWTYLSCQVCRLCQLQDDKPGCSACGTEENLWICIICSFVGCGRYKEGHAIRHWKDTKHCYSLDLRTQQIWDYVGDNYVHRLTQSKTDGKSIHQNKSCSSLEHDPGTCDDAEDSGISNAVYDVKVEAIVDEYNLLLATQLEAQRQHYESLIMEEKNVREVAITEALEGAIDSTIQDLHNQLDQREAEKHSVAEVNRNLIREQEVLRKKFKEIEERQTCSLVAKDETIHDLEEQIRDITFYMKAQTSLGASSVSDDIRQGQVLPVTSNQSLVSKNRRSRKHRKDT